MKLEQLQAELLNVRKAKNKVATAVLRSLIADFDKQARTGKEVDGMSLIRKYISIAGENCDLENKRGNFDAAEKYFCEKVFLETLLPVQLKEAELRNIISTGNFKNIGEVMKFLRFNYQGQYDGGLASKIAREVL